MAIDFVLFALDFEEYKDIIASALLLIKGVIAKYEVIERIINFYEQLQGKHFREMRKQQSIQS